MTDAKQCDCCERFAPPLEVLTLEARTPRLAGDGSIEYDHWPGVDVCRSCLTRPMGEVLGKACNDFDFTPEPDGAHPDTDDLAAVLKRADDEQNRDDEVSIMGCYRNLARAAIKWHKERRPDDSAAIGTECPLCREWHRDGHEACGCEHCLPEREGAVAPVRPAKAARAEAWRRSGSDYVVTIGPCEHGPFTSESTAAAFRDALNACIDAERRVAELGKEVDTLKGRLAAETKERREYSDRLGCVIRAVTAELGL